MTTRPDNGAQIIPFPRRELEPWVDKHAVADYLGCSVSWVQHNGRDIPGSRIICGKRKWRMSDVERYVEEQAS